jgi:hypothetical protein
MEGMLSKLTILAFLDCDYTKPAGVYFAQVNPDRYTLDYAVELAPDQAAGTSGKNAVFHLKEPEKLSFEFLFDSTGVVDPGLSIHGAAREFGYDTGVEYDISLFKKFLLEVDGKTHQPKYLILRWGGLLFKCVLETLSIEYTLFKPDGTPIRAIAKANFKGSIPDLLRLAKDKLSSPDLTHTREVKASDTLLNLCNDIYSDPALYIKIAEINHLTNFRKLRTGRKVYFPPIDKTAK